MARAPKDKRRCGASGKVRYSNERQALAFAERAIPHPMRAYRCPSCGKWHLATAGMQGSLTQKLRARARGAPG